MPVAGSQNHLIFAAPARGGTRHLVERGSDRPDRRRMLRAVGSLLHSSCHPYISRFAHQRQTSSVSSVSTERGA